ncbi:MAG: DNA polymerase III subunit alpha, partial [Bdellovibrionales bacterium]|nr:DNA polymerase III subunit alpha [Bdellovibrionales bacterium]
FSTKDISLKDQGIYSIMCKGDTAGIFQFEGEGITDLIRKAQPNCFEDIVAINALYRPGPMDMIPDYLARKNGSKKVEYLFSQLEDILKETYVIVVYQEQVQLIASRIANYSLGEADVLRRAMGKKNAEEMARQKSRFLDGAQKNSHDLEKAEELFDLMAKFAEYGFNKSHAAAYCVVAAYTAYLKNYYPVEFYAALLSTEMSDTDKIVKYVKDARRRGINVRPPHISFSEFKFNVVGEEIAFSLGAIKGVGEAAVEAIVEAREKTENKKFDSLEQFFELVDLRRVNKKTIESLIKAGALDDFGYNRAELSLGYTKFIERADKRRKDNELGQESLFAFAAEENPEMNGKSEGGDHDAVLIDSAPEWTRSARLTYEKEVLGFYLSGHPLDGIDDLLKAFVTSNVSGLENSPSKSKVSVAGLISTLKEIITKKGTRMAFATFEDTSGSLELVIFPDVFAKNEALLKTDGALIISGVLEKGETFGEGSRPALKILVDKVQSAQDLLKTGKQLTICLSTEKFTNDEMASKLSLLKEIMIKHPGSTSFILQVELAEMDKIVDLEVSDPRGIDPSPQFFEKITGLLDEPKWSLN